MRYHYPDTTDQLVSKYVAEHTPYQGYWQESEDYMFQWAFSLLKKKQCSFRDMLDIGAGQGRLLPLYSTFFSRLTVIEPDLTRLQLLTEKAERLSIPIRALPHTLASANIEPESCDVVFCQHVIQHIHTDDIAPFIARTFRLLRSGGYLVLSTNHTSTGERFTFLAPRNKKVEEIPITQFDFNMLVQNNKGYLPIHYFSIRRLKQLINAPTIGIWVYHDQTPFLSFDTQVFRDSVFNFPFIRNFFGRHVTLIIKKP